MSERERLLLFSAGKKSEKVVVVKTLSRHNIIVSSWWIGLAGKVGNIRDREWECDGMEMCGPVSWKVMSG